MARSAKVIDLTRAEDRRDVIHEVVQSLAAGQLVQLPTETGPIVAASALDEKAASRMGKFCGERHVSDCALAVLSPEEALDYLPSVSAQAHRLMRRFLPAPLTLQFDSQVAGGLLHALPELTQKLLLASSSLSLRVPSEETFSEVARLLPGPLILADERSMADDHIAETDAAPISLAVESGQRPRGFPTTRVRIDGGRWELMREGIVARRAVHRLAAQFHLFICTGNTCRSPMAEGLFRKLLAERLGCDEDELDERGFVAASAGIAAGVGAPPSPEAVEVLKRRGAEIHDHCSQPASDTLLSQADAIYTMTRSHRDHLARINPEWDAKMRLLCRDGADVLDPIGSGLDEYVRCADQIERSVRLLLDELFAADCEPRP